MINEQQHGFMLLNRTTDAICAWRKSIDDQKESHCAFVGIEKACRSTVPRRGIVAVRSGWCRTCIRKARQAGLKWGWDYIRDHLLFVYIGNRHPDK